MTADLTEEQRQDALNLSAEILGHALNRDAPAAQARVQELNRRYRNLGIYVLLFSLADTMLAVQGSRGRSGKQFMPIWVDSRGAVGFADDVPPGVRWAGRFIAARAADDEAAAVALINSCADDQEWNDCASALLHVTVKTITVFEGATSGEPGSR